MVIFKEEHGMRVHSLLYSILLRKNFYEIWKLCLLGLGWVSWDDIKIYALCTFGINQSLWMSCILVEKGNGKSCDMSK